MSGLDETLRQRAAANAEAVRQLFSVPPTTDSSPESNLRTHDAAVEILARELYVVGHITANARVAREGWYRRAPERTRDGWRNDARRLLASLRESGLALTWLPDEQVPDA